MTLDSDLSAPLDPSVLALAQDLPVPPNFDADFTREQSPAASTSAPPGQSSSENRAEKKISKWLKLGPSMSFTLCTRRFGHSSVITEK